MPAKAVIHIGAPKCGSTFLQRVLKANEASLSEHGWDLPLMAVKHPGTDLSILQDYEAALQPSIDNGQNVFISHEGFLKSSKKADGLMTHLDANFDEVSVICFVRPIEEMVYGSFSQHMKQNMKSYWESKDPYGGNFDDFVRGEAEKPGIARGLRQWQNIRGETPIAVSSHKAILEVLGNILPVSLDTNVAKAQINKSLRVIDCEMIADKIRSEDLTWDELGKLRNSAAKNAYLEDTGRTAERRKFIRTTMKGEISVLNRVFGVKI